MANAGNKNQKSSKVAFTICILLIALTWTVFGQTLGHEFTNYDDPDYVTAAPAISAGLNPHGIVWAFTHSHAWNWHPITTISHMLDCQLYGLKPGGHHCTNVVLHTLAVVLLFLVLANMTGAAWRSAFVAALFAIHPLRVESVAWISERKDVLSAVFFMLTLGAYLRYVRKPSVTNYVLVAVMFALGLMSKPMLVTLPFVLLLLDYWPLKRFSTAHRAIDNSRESTQPNRESGWARLVLEKLPLVLLSAISSIVTVLVQQPAGYMAQVPFPSRLINALLSCVTYVYQMFWPVKLAPFYPYRTGSLSIWILLCAVLLLGITTLGVVLLRKRYPYGLTGWFWYLIMLVPVIGIIRVGGQAQADRYTYLPHIGLYIGLTWLVSDLTAFWRQRRIILGVGAVTVVFILAWRAWFQTSFWKDSESVWSRALVVTTSNPLAHNNLGSALAEKGRTAAAISHYQIALGLQPRFALAHRNLAKALFQQGDLDNAISHWQQSLSFQPDNPDAFTGLGDALFKKGQIAEAISHYEIALQGAPQSGSALNNFAWLLATCSDRRFRDAPRAVQLAEKADQLARGKNPLFARTLAAAYALAGRFNDAIKTAQRALPLAAAKGDSDLVAGLRLDIDLYKINLPVR